MSKTINISQLSQYQISKRLSEFKRNYDNDWKKWTAFRSENVSDRDMIAAEASRYLRKWQAFRPNRATWPRENSENDAPKIENVVKRSWRYIESLQNFDLSDPTCFDDAETEKAFKGLWKQLKAIAYNSNTKKPAASVVGISKAAMLLSDGRIGPGFDSTVCFSLRIIGARNADEWIEDMRKINSQIILLQEIKQKCFMELVPSRYSSYQSGRIVDMILGPR